MIQLEQQLHGYRQGHQLLSASARLPKSDQDLVDRLSDVAGPLRPGEIFDPYLTFYPLPSGASYVLARTWQDDEAPRAGCVRTRSLIVPMAAWTEGVGVLGMADALTTIGPTAPAERMEGPAGRTPFPLVDVTEGMDLVEAMFLEERKPVAVFGASNPEAMALRIIAAVWPSLRRTIAVSTFALSPRTISGRTFDVVFAPKDARPRFTGEWGGRRIDARKPAGGRHRWSAKLVGRVFVDDQPSLLRGSDPGELTADDVASEADLRVSLLWSELREKLATSPDAALGLLDIANSRKPRNFSAIEKLEPALARAAGQAAGSLPPSAAWDFLLALNDKLGGVRLTPAATHTLGATAAGLALRFPRDAVAIVGTLAQRPGRDLLLRAVADAVASKLDVDLATGFDVLEPHQLLQLLLISPALAQASLAEFPVFLDKLAKALPTAPDESIDAAKRQLLPLLVEDRQAAAARLLIDKLDEDELIAEARLLARENAFGAAGLHEPLANRAREIGATHRLRDTVAGTASGSRADDMLVRLIAPARDDMTWLLDTSLIQDERRLDLARRVLTPVDDTMLVDVVSSVDGDALLRLLMREPQGSFALVDRTLATGLVEKRTLVDTTIRLLPVAGARRAPSLAWRALTSALPTGADGERDVILDKLLSNVGEAFDGKVAYQQGLGRTTSADVAAANLAAFDRAPDPTRRRLLLSIEQMADALVARGRLDLPDRGAVPAANLLWASAAIDRKAFIRASATLLPFLLRTPTAPASRLIAAAFPPVYQQLKKEDETPDPWKFFGLVSWDRCKAARQELVDGFAKSDWKPADIALAAARTGDVQRIVTKIAKHKHGGRLLKSVESGLSAVPNPWRDQVRRALTKAGTAPVRDVFKA